MSILSVMNVCERHYRFNNQH
uniref:Uncharacterized protein n=1 Tax=Anguilla anguilla TaxID=7936 RepID=A0A0E9R3W0_ANGAN